MQHCTFTGHNYTCNRKAEKTDILSMTKAVCVSTIEPNGPGKTLGIETSWHGRDLV